MSGNDLTGTWRVNIEVVDPWGVCVGPPPSRSSRYSPYRSAYAVWDDDTPWLWYFFTARENVDGEGYFYREHQWTINLADLISDHVRRCYNLSDDIEINTPESSWYDWRYHWIRNHDGRAMYSGTNFIFETEAEALEYVDTLENPSPEITFSSGDILFESNWRQPLGDGWLDKRAVFKYTGDDVVLYTINDFINFYALPLGVTPEEIPIEYEYDPRDELDNPDPDGPPALDCSPSQIARVYNYDGTRSRRDRYMCITEHPIDSNIDTVIDNVPVTTIDEDIDISVPTTMIENGPGSVTISDNGNILMLNEGGTFFLNEFGNVGFYANGDASLTADNQVQLGVGQNSVTVENGSLTIRDETGSATLTAEDINRLKETLT